MKFCQDSLLLIQKFDGIKLLVSVFNDGFNSGAKMGIIMCWKTFIVLPLSISTIIPNLIAQERNPATLEEVSPSSEMAIPPPVTSFLTFKGVELSVNGLLEGLSSTDKGTKFHCLIGLRHIGGIKEVPALLDMYEDTDSMVRLVAINAVNHIVSKHNLAHAEKLWKESEQALSVSVVAARLDFAKLLLDLGETRHYRYFLEELANHEGFFVRAIRIVPDLNRYNIIDEEGNPIDWTAILRDLLFNPEVPSIDKPNIINALAKIHSNQSLGVLRDFITKTSEPELKKYAENILQQLSRKPNH